MVRVIRIDDAFSGQACHFSREFPAGRGESVFRKRSAADADSPDLGKARCRVARRRPRAPWSANRPHDAGRSV